MITVQLENFTEGELSCKCCLKLVQNNEALISLQAFRYFLNRKYGKNIRLTPTCGARCAKHNVEVKGAKNSLHLTGQAFDLISPDISFEQIYSAAIESNLFSTVIRYNKSKFVHVDTRQRNRYSVQNCSWEK